METFVQSDDAGRVEYVRRGLPGAPELQAWYYYLDNDLLAHVDYPTGASTWYLYDAANRVTEIEHRSLGAVVLKLVYVYTDNDLVASITEYDAGSQTSSVMFGYDNRSRLISEIRFGVGAYNLAYEYDQAGNRTEKIDSPTPFSTIEIDYHYDYEDVTTYGSDNNRLMYYETKTCTSGQTSATSSGTTTELSASGEEIPLAGGAPAAPAAPGGPGGPGCEDVSETYYYYNSQGNVTRVVTKDLSVNPPGKRFAATRLTYAKNDRTVAFALGEEWNEDGGGQPIDHVILWWRAFRYEGARQRYLNRALDPAGLLETPIEHNPLPGGDTWSDYDGNSVYGNFTVDAGVATTTKWFEPGLAELDDPEGTPVTNHYHGDMIGSMRLMTEAISGTVTQEAVYTAFGELRSGSSTRYGYAGAHGYQTHEAGDMPFLHLGHRYYDPATGRFLQRDPIGIRGGRNVYEYANGNPVGVVDPTGTFSLGFIGAVVGGVIGGVVGGITGGIPGAIGGAIGGAITGGLIGSGVSPSTAGAIGGAVGGAVAGGLGGYGGGRGPGGIVAGGVVGGVGGGVVGGVGGRLPGGGAGTSGTVGLGSGYIGSAVQCYFYDLPSSIVDAGNRLRR